MLFYTEHRDAVKARIIKPNKPSKPEEISKEITRLWCTLDAERMRDYCLLSNLYAESLAKHGGAAGGGGGHHHNNKRKLGKRRKKDPRLPKPPVSSFMWFSRHHRAILKNEHRELSFCEVGKAIGALWKAATVAEKRPFDDLAAEVRYGLNGGFIIVFIFTVSQGIARDETVRIRRRRWRDSSSGCDRREPWACLCLTVALVELGGSGWISISCRVSLFWSGVVGVGQHYGRAPVCGVRLSGMQRHNDRELAKVT